VEYPGAIYRLLYHSERSPDVEELQSQLWQKDDNAIDWRFLLGRLLAARRGER
jgi:hypothetical protein